jgi:alpha-beta hydrolase superfamily lysophospholipase
MRWRKIRNWFFITLLIYVLIGIALYFLQEKFLFHPVPLPAGHKYNLTVPFKEINLEVNKEKRLGIVQFTVPDSICRGVVLYFHGNRGNIERYAPLASNFTKNKYEVWMIDYPGYGKTTGECTEKLLYDDAHEFYKMARARFSKDSIIIYGRSIGTGIASELASAKDCKRLILEAPFYSMDALMSQYTFIYPVSWITKYHFPVYKYAKNVDAPITIFHGTDDEVIPYRNSKRLLASEIESKKNEIELVTIENAEHNNLNDFPVFHHKLDSLLQRP